MNEINNHNDYETHARSNESLRDSMDGKLNEPHLSQSTENNNQNIDQNSRCDGSQSMD